MPTDPPVVCIWPKGSYILEHIQWIQGELPEADMGEELLKRMNPSGFEDKIDSATWFQLTEEIGLPESIAISIFENVANYREKAEKLNLATDFILLQISRKMAEFENRDDAICAFFHDNMERFIRLLLWKYDWKAEGKELTALDQLFEASIDDDETTLSNVVQSLWFDVRSTRQLAKRISVCLIPDIFSICAFQSQDESKKKGLRKKTTLAPFGKRIVLISGWYRLQLLTKGVFHGCHLRISHSMKDPAEIFAPNFSLSVIVNDVSNCPCIHLGPCAGTVHLKTLKNCRITVTCRRLIVEDCHDVTIFTSSLHSPIVMFSSDVAFGPLNVTYSGMWDELESANLALQLNFQPLNEDEQWFPLPESYFYIQPVPIVCNKDDINRLLKLIPVNYALAWKKTVKRIQGGEESGLRPADIEYLKSKIE